ncbi:MAG: hypothetical protein VX834_13635 [Myxococcota bacterium]|nr:hypothetical protein [Myxococcota bacterium]
MNSGHDVEASQFEPDHILHEHGQTDQADRHELTLSMLNLSASLSWFIDSVWSVAVVAPVRIVQSEATFLAEDSELQGFGSIHHRDEVLVGLADPVIQARASQMYAFEDNARLHLSGFLGASLPLGKTEPNPDALGRAGLKHQHIFFGRGAVAPMAGFNAHYMNGRFSLDGWLNATVPVYENEYGYLANRDISIGIGLNHSLGLPDWVFGLLTDIHHDGAAYWDGAPQRNSGRTDFILGAKVQWDWNRGSHASLEVKRPVYSVVNGGQLEIPIMISLTFGHAIL